MAYKGDAVMVRFVHKQLAYALVIGVSGLIAATVGVAANGPVRLPGWWFIAAIAAWGVFWGSPPRAVC